MHELNRCWIHCACHCTSILVHGRMLVLALGAFCASGVALPAPSHYATHVLVRSLNSGIFSVRPGYPSSRNGGSQHGIQKR
jgi:hypothetical protein